MTVNMQFYVHLEAEWNFSKHYGMQHYDGIIQDRLQFGDKLTVIDMNSMTSHGNKYYLLHDRTKLYTQMFEWEVKKHLKHTKPFNSSELWDKLNDDL